VDRLVLQLQQFVEAATYYCVTSHHAYSGSCDVSVLPADNSFLVRRLMHCHSHSHERGTIAPITAGNETSVYFNVAAKKLDLIVKYDKYTCKKWAVGLGYNKNTRYKIHNERLAIWKIKCTIKYKLHTVLEVGQGIVKEGLIFFLVLEYGIGYFKGLRTLEKISLLRSE